MTGLAPIRPHWAALASLSVILAAATLLDARPARAADAKASAPSGPLVADIDAGSSGLDPERLRAAIERELGVGVRARSAQDPGSALSIRLGDGRRATVRFQSTPGRVLERTLELPADSERSYETIALLTGNLARDEASELIEELRRSRTSPDATASETPQPATDAEAKPPEQTPPPAQPPAPKRREPAKKAKAKPSAESEAAQPALAATPVNLSFFYPLALYRDADRRRIALELGFAHSRVGAIDVAGVTFGYLDVRHTLRGVGLAVGLNRVAGDVKGAQIAVGGNLGGGDLRGAALAVGFNHRKGTTEGVAVAVGYNETARFEGAQLSLVNVAARKAGATDFRGVGQRGGPADRRSARAGQRGAELRGVQLGLVNVGGEIEGATVGLVNVADRVDGLALGLVNVVGNARTRFAAWADSSGRAQHRDQVPAEVAFHAAVGGLPDEEPERPRGPAYRAGVRDRRTRRVRRELPRARRAVRVPSGDGRTGQGAAHRPLPADGWATMR